MSHPPLFERLVPLNSRLGSQSPLYKTVGLTGESAVWWSRLTVNKAQPRITWEEREAEGSVRSGWPVGKPGQTVLITLADVRRASLEVHSTFSCLGDLDCVRVENSMSPKFHSLL